MVMTYHSELSSDKKGAICERLVESVFAEHGYSTFIPAWGQQPIQDLVAIRGHDVRLVQVKKGRRRVDKRRPSCYKETLSVSFIPGGVKNGIYSRNKDSYQEKKIEFNTVAVVWDGEVALFDDPTLWSSGGFYISTNSSANPKSPLFKDYVNPSWLTGEDTSPVATEPKLSVAV